MGASGKYYRDRVKSMRTKKGRAARHGIITATNDKRTDEKITHARRMSHNRVLYRESSKGPCATEQPRKLLDESQSRVAERTCTERGSYDDQQIHRCQSTNKERIIMHAPTVK